MQFSLIPDWPSEGAFAIGFIEDLQRGEPVTPLLIQESFNPDLVHNSAFGFHSSLNFLCPPFERGRKVMPADFGSYSLIGESRKG
jgi:hypothetical protein